MPESEIEVTPTNRRFKHLGARYSKDDLRQMKEGRLSNNLKAANYHITVCHAYIADLKRIAIQPKQDPDLIKMLARHEKKLRRFKAKH